jgi:hypothetical protein
LIFSIPDGTARTYTPRHTSLVCPETLADDDPSLILNYVEKLEPWISKVQEEVSKLAQEVYRDGTDTGEMEEKEQANEGGVGSPPTRV